MESLMKSARLPLDATPVTLSGAEIAALLRLLEFRLANDCPTAKVGMEAAAGKEAKEPSASRRAPVSSSCAPLA